MSKVVSIVGARPQFIKAAPVSRALAAAGVAEVLVHTGQHYDANMSAVFFRELGLAEPAHHLGIGGGTHAEQAGAMLPAIERVLLAERPGQVIVYGDTNSTLAGALAAAKLHIPVVHIEAGLRSFDRRMPEEVNRVLVDHMSALLLTPSQPAADNLAAEGIRHGVHVVGDVMRDSLELAAGLSREHAPTLQRLGLREAGFVLATVHRQENTAGTAGLLKILDALGRLEEAVVFPLHPRTRKLLAEAGVPLADVDAAAGRIGRFGNLQFIEPLGYLDMVCLLKAARLVVTDSGGVQKEAYWLRTPCVTLRNTTEWVETVHTGWNRLAGTDPDVVVKAVRDAARPAEHPELYGRPGASERIAALLRAAARS